MLSFLLFPLFMQHLLMCSLSFMLVLDSMLVLLCDVMQLHVSWPVFCVSSFMFVFLFLLFLYLYWLASSWCFCSHYFVYYFPRYGHARQVIDLCFCEAHCTSCNVMRQCPSGASNCAFYFSTTSLVFSFLYTTVTACAFLLWPSWSYATVLLGCASLLFMQRYGPCFFFC